MRQTSKKKYPAKRIKRRFRPSPPRFFLLTTQKFSWALLALLSVGLLAFAIFSDLFHIKKILCLHGESPCSAVVEAELSKFMGKSILTFRADQLERTLRQADIAVESVDVKPKLPHTIQVKLSSRGSTITLSIATSSAVLYVDDQLVPFKLDETSQKPTQIISDKVKYLSLGEQIIDPVIVSAIRLNRELKDNFISFQNIEALDDRLQVLLKNNTLAIFTINSDFSKTVPSLQYILQEDTIGQRPKQIDLRFNKPVLRF